MNSIVERHSVNVRTGPAPGWPWKVLLVLCACAFSAIPRLAAQPVNDRFTNATVLIGSFGTTAGITVGSTAEPFEPIHYNALTAGRQHSVWFRWVAPI